MKNLAIHYFLVIYNLMECTMHGLASNHGHSNNRKVYSLHNRGLVRNK